MSHELQERKRQERTVDRPLPDLRQLALDPVPPVLDREFFLHGPVPAVLDPELFGLDPEISAHDPELFVPDSEPLEQGPELSRRAPEAAVHDPELFVLDPEFSVLYLGRQPLDPGRLPRTGGRRRKQRRCAM